MNGLAADVSVIIPLKDCEQFIADAIRSVWSQSLKAREIIIIDDGCTDGSIGLVEKIKDAGDVPVCILNGPGKGPGPARNVGIKQAGGEFVAFLDADDLWPANKLELQMTRFAATPHVDVVAGYVQYFQKQTDDELAPDPDSVIEEMYHVHLGASIYRRSVFEEIGLFDERFMYAEDVDMVLRVRESALVMSILDLITLYYRRHDSSMTAKFSPVEKRDFNKAVFLSLVRRKRAGLVGDLPPFSELIGY
jgi:glycosyltransferase involved in cell wall biosynthesis